MPKKILRDVITSSVVGKKTTTKRSEPEKNNTFGRHSSIDVRMPSATHKRGHTDGRRSSGFAIWAVAGVSVFFLLFVLLTYFSGTVVEVTPLQKNVVVNGNFLAQKTPDKGELSFKLIVLEDSLKGEVPATTEKEIEKKAFGKIIIYNKYSSKSQKLVKRTRFETADGKIYRINKSVVVPGYTKKDGKIVAGSAEVTVYSNIPGEEYNIGLTDFTIPGFKGSPRFNKFYARSKTPIKEGFSGTVKTASLEDISKTEEDLQNSLKETLLAQARSQVPGDFILYDDAVFFLFKNKNNSIYSIKDSIEITEKGSLYGVLLNKNELSKYIAADTVVSYDGSDVKAQGLEDLKLSVTKRDEFNPVKDTNFNFTLSGPVKIIWKIDRNAITQDLAGKNKIDFLDIIGKYSNIQKASATVRPFWKKTFPENSEDIVIKEINLASGD